MRGHKARQGRRALVTLENQSNAVCGSPAIHSLPSRRCGAITGSRVALRIAGKTSVFGKSVFGEARRLEIDQYI
jgi:hypothetical protein